jgi:hypothetical protein
MRSKEMNEPGPSGSGLPFLLGLNANNKASPTNKKLCGRNQTQAGRNHMLHSLYRAGLFAALFGLLLVPGTAWAQRTRQVHDEAKLFSKDTIEQVNRTIAKIKEKHKKDLYIETLVKGPDKTEATPNWTKARFNDSGIDGIYIVISKDPSYYRDFVGDNTRSNGYFTTSNIEKMNEILKGGILNKDKRDAALIEVANYTLEVMNEHALTKGKAAPPKADPAPAKKNQPVAHQDAPENTMPAWVSWACLIIGVLVVVWIVFAIIRSLTSMMGGGYGGGMGGGYGGGGMGMGGGMLTGMLGGMFGAMAGMWLYNNMFGGHANYGHDGNVNWGGGNQGGATGSDSAPYEADTSGGGTAGGGDGDDDAGGGGGGDAGGGGGDAGGGGDWGGGGGGVGGGGVWGGGGDAGGGGGDWGGGGGDFGGGGGGGGGDW